MISTIGNWLQQATDQLQNAGIPSARLDAELLLAHTLHKSRTFLHAHDTDTIPRHLIDIADTRLSLRLDRVPVAYIIGHKEFYGRQFRVTPSTLIPRPESEALITLLKAIDTKTPLQTIADIGTGSGCLGITAKLECPEATVFITDISHYALKVAETNARLLKAAVTPLTGSLLEPLPGPVDCITANLPYVDISWERSPETSHEPARALFANDAGLALIKTLIARAPAYLRPKGHILIEAHPSQHATLIAFAKNYGFLHKITDGFAFSLQLH